MQELTVAAPGSDTPIVSNVSFSLKAGMGLALLGASASGKTSLSKALVGIWPAQHGVVRLDGAAIDQWRNEDLGRHIGYLPQDVALFDGTVAENICRFDEDATSEAILKAAQIAGVHDIILRLPEGYSTRIGQGGMSLSAGQRQRIGLARAVFGDPFLVVLDEPNANLDADGENALGRAIEILRQNKSIVIVISHRPSALAALNMALVLYEGKSIAFGSCQEIFARVGGSTTQGAPQTAGRNSNRPAPRYAAVPRALSHAVMKIIDRLDDESTRWSDEPYADSVGPQGAALILELQRLRQALTVKPERRAIRLAHLGAPPSRNVRAGVQARQNVRRKSSVEQAIDVCLEPFGFKAPVQTEAGSSRR